MKPTRVISLAVALALSLGPASAFAQEDGVTYDPDSPAGKEYQLPLEAARGTGGGGGAGGASSQPGGAPAGPSGSSAAAQASGGALFGAGITPVGGSRARSGGAKGSTKGGAVTAAMKGGAKERARRNRQSARAVGRERKNFDATVAASPGASPIAVGGLTAAGALVLALAAALASRRWRSRRSAD